MPKLAPHVIGSPWDPGTYAWERTPTFTKHNHELTAEAVSSALWKKLDTAVVGATRTRAEAHKAMAMTQAGIDSSFSPHGREACIKARAFIAQAGRVLSRLNCSMELLEAAALAAQKAHDCDAVSWIGEMQLLSNRKDAQSEATSRALKGEHLALSGWRLVLCVDCV